MKLLKNSLLIVALLGIGSISAKAAKGAKGSTTATTQQPVTEAPALPSRQSFQTLLMRVRMMPSNEVFDAQNAFTNQFTNLVKGANLNPEQTRALLEAGRNLHLPLSGKDDQDRVLMISIGNRIDELVASSTPILTPIKLSPIINEDLQVEDLVTDYYYDQDEATLKQGYLNQRIQELSAQNKSRPQMISILQAELNPKMRRAWADNKVGSIATRTNQLNKQIKDAVESTKPLTIGMPAPAPTFGMKDMTLEISNAVKSKAKPRITRTGIDPKWLAEVLGSLKTTVLDANSADVVAAIMVENLKPHISQEEHGWLSRGILRDQIRDMIINPNKKIQTLPATQGQELGRGFIQTLPATQGQELGRTKMRPGYQPIPEGVIPTRSGYQSID